MRSQRSGLIALAFTVKGFCFVHINKSKLRLHLYALSNKSWAKCILCNACTLLYNTNPLLSSLPHLPTLLHLIPLSALLLPSTSQSSTLTSAGNVSTWGILLIASTKGVFALFTISSKDSIMLRGLWNSKYVAAAVPCFFSRQPKRRMKPEPSCTSSRRRSITKCQGKALQKVATPIWRLSTEVEDARFSWEVLRKFLFVWWGWILYL